jgi:hypothetical protein
MHEISHIGALSLLARTYLGFVENSEKNMSHRHAPGKINSSLHFGDINLMLP